MCIILSLLDLGNQKFKSLSQCDDGLFWLAIMNSTSNSEENRKPWQERFLWIPPKKQIPLYPNSGFHHQINALLTQRSAWGLTTCSSKKGFWFSFLGKLIDFESERADWIESKLNLAWVFTEIESSVFLCLFCPPGVLQINPQPKRSVVTEAFSGTGAWWMGPSRFWNGLRLKASQRSRYPGWSIYSFAGDPVNDSTWSLWQTDAGVLMSCEKDTCTGYGWMSLLRNRKKGWEQCPRCYIFLTLIN